MVPEKAQLTLTGGLFGVVWMQFPACAPALLLSSLDGSQLGAGLNNDWHVDEPITRSIGHLSDLMHEATRTFSSFVCVK